MDRSSPLRQRVRVAVTRRLANSVETRMAELFDARLRKVDTPMTREELAAAMADSDMLVPTVTDHIDANLLAGAGERLRLTDAGRLLADGIITDILAAE